MIQKNLLSYSKNLVILMIVGLLFTITPIINYDYCYDKNMKGYYLDYDNFEQYNEAIVPNLYKQYMFLGKHYFYYGSRIGYGNIREKIDFKRSFHIGLRYTPYWDPEPGLDLRKTNYGFAVVFGPYKAKSYQLNSDLDYFLVDGLTNSFAIVFNFIDHKVSIFDCLKKGTVCSIKNPSKPAKKFEELKENNFIYVNIIYSASEHWIKVFKNDYNIETNRIITYNDVYIPTSLEKENGWGYLGITGTDFKGNYFLNLYATYYCINGSDTITPKVSLSYGDYEVSKNGSTITVPPNKIVTLKVVYNTETESKLMGPGWISINGKKVPLVAKSDKNKYTFEYTTELKCDNYTFIYHTDYDAFKFIINVGGGKITQLDYIYGEKPGDKDEIINGIRYLKYGTLNGDFDYSILYNKYLYFHVQPKDEYDQIADIDEKSLEGIRKDLENHFKLDVSLSKIEGNNHIYKVGVKITKKGQYTLYSSYINPPIYFTVKNLIPSISSCEIENYTSIAYDSGKNVIYTCQFLDEESKAINIEESIELIGLKIETSLYRDDEFLEKINNRTCSGDKCFFIYETSYNGNFKFEAEYGIDEMKTIDSTKNKFYVSPEPTSLEGCRIYDFESKNWIEYDSIEDYIFKYNEDKEYDIDNFFLIDLLDIKDKQKKKRYSEIEQAYIHFNPNKISADIKEEHSKYEGKLSFEIYEFENKKYILAKLSNAKEEMRRTSFTYKVVLDFDIVKTLQLKYILKNIGDNIACRKDIQIDNSQVKVTRTNSITAGETQKMGELILRTDCDHLYNYFLNDSNRITFEEENGCINQGTCDAWVVESNIDGIYNLMFTSNIKGTYKIFPKIDGYKFTSKDNYYTVTVDPIYQAYYITKNDTEKSEYIVGEDEIKFKFIIKDKYGNIINEDLNSNNFDLKYSVSINNGEPTSNNIKLEKGDDDFYYIKETQSKAGNYALTIKAIYEEITFNYYKEPGKAYVDNSRIKVLNSYKINIREKSTVELTLVDYYNNYISPDSKAYERELKNVQIYAENGNHKKFNYYSVDGKFTSDSINITGTYHVYGLIYGSEISNCISCNFEVVNYGYDFYLSQLKMIADKIILMQKYTIYNLYEGLQRPAFEFDFLTEEGLPSNKIDEDIEIKAQITNIEDENDYEELNKTWIDINKLVWTLSDEYQLKKDKTYRIDINNNNTIYSYYIAIVGYGEDTSSQSKYNINNTFVSPNVLNLRAGVSELFIVELRDEYNLRYNQTLNLDDFDYVASKNLNVTKKLGNKNGQIIVEVKSDKTCDVSENCKIELFYNGESINTEVNVIVSSDDLEYFVIDSSSFKNESEAILVPGQAGSETKIYLTPYDKYGNKIKDSVFDSKIYSTESFSYLFNFKHEKGYKTSIKSSTNPVSYKVELSLSSEKSGNVVLSSIYLDKEYQMEITPGSPSKYSDGYLEDLEGNSKNTPAGTDRKFIIIPKDENGNKIEDDEIIESIINEYKVKIYDLDGNLIDDGIKPSYNKETKEIEYIIDNKKAETKVIEAFYNDEKIIVNNNVINVVSGDVFLNNTELLYNGKKYSIFDTLKLSLNSIPIIDLILYDSYGNEIDIRNYKSSLRSLYSYENGDDETNYNNIDLILEVNGNQLSNTMNFNKYLRLFIDDSKIDDYFGIKTTDDSELYVILDGKKHNINILFVDHAPSKDTEVPTSFILNEDNLILKAGEKGIISVTFYTEKGKPMGYFFEKDSDIVVSCEDENIKTHILKGINYGTYNIMASSTNTTKDVILCSLFALNENETFGIRVIPEKMDYCQIEKEDSKLADGKCGESYSLTFKCFDKFDNLANLENENLGAKITDPDNEIMEYNINSKNEEIYNLYVKPKKSGYYIIKSIYFPEDYEFYSKPGDASPENSYLEIDKSAQAGDNLEIKIHVLDEFGNEAILKEEDKYIFDLYYRYINNSKYTDYQKIDGEPELINNTIIKYKQIIKKDGVNEFRGIEPKSSTILKCQNCEVKVIPGEFDLEGTDVFKFNTFSQSYTKLKKYNDALYNLDEELFIKIYPKDKYGNKVSTKDLNEAITVTIDGKNLALFSYNEEYLEFHEINGEYAKLNGEKQLKISKDGKTVIYNVYITNKVDYDEDIDPSNTKLLETNLEFTAGKSGYFNFELRYANNVRYNKQNNKEIKITSKDEEVKFTIFNKKSSVVFVLVTSNKANVYPNDRESNVEVEIDSQKVFDLELLINPGELSKAKINPIYLKDDKLIPISIDENLQFSLIGYDSLYNKVLLNANEVKLLLTNENKDEISYKKIYVDLTSGEQNYIYELTSEGTYEITSEEDNLLEQGKYTVEVRPGKIFPKNTKVNIKKNPITAGEGFVITINVKDKYNNDVILSNSDLDDFKAYIISDKYNIIKLDGEIISDSSIKYEIYKLEESGTYQFNINYIGFNGGKIKCPKLIVNPSTCSLDKTLIYSKDKNGNYIPFKGNNIYSSNNNPLRLRLIYRDEYSNKITDYSDITVDNAYLSGNNMEELYWKYENNELYLDLTDSNNKYILEHLVTRTGSNAYRFKFTIKYKENEKQYDLPVNHFGKKENEDEYGNGDYDIYKSLISTDVAKFRVGSTFEVILTLKTQENLTYNGEFDIDYINCDELDPDDGDPTFTCTKYKKDTGVYSLIYYSTLYKEEEVKNIIKLYNSNHTKSRKFEVLLVNINGIPSKEGTEVKEFPKKIKEGEIPRIKFILRDEYNNTFDTEDIIEFLSLENNNIALTDQIHYDDVNKYYYSDLSTLSYPPKQINLQLYFYLDKEKDNRIELFKEVVKSEFVFDINYENTVVISKNVNKMKAGDDLDLNIYLYDTNYECYNEDEDKSDLLLATVQGPLETSIEMRTYHFERQEDPQLRCKYIYKIIFDEKYVTAGTYSIIVYAGEKKLQIATYSQTLTSGDIDENNFVVYYNQNDKSSSNGIFHVGETIYFIVQAYDKYNNKIDHEKLSSEIFKIEVTPDISEIELNKYVTGSGSLQCLFLTTKDGEYEFNYYYNNSKITPDTTHGPKIITYLPGECSEENPQVTYPTNIEISSPFIYTITCLDKYNNSVSVGGAEFTSEVSIYIEDADNKLSLPTKIVDNQNGSYSISFTPPLAGEYTIYTKLNGNNYDELKFNLTGETQCEKLVCPNDITKCVDDLRYCIPDEMRCLDGDKNETMPFKCKDTGECVESMTECNPPEGMRKCRYMNALYPEDKEYLCAYFLKLDCKRKYPKYKVFCDDGICRTNQNLQPNQRVCPIGKFLCVDLTCKDSVEDCYNDWPKCESTQVRCPDQSCADDQKNCPTTITCPNPNDYACPDGSCVENEIYCSKLKICPEETPYLCTDNSCATTPENCPHTVACGHGKSLCSDLICREDCNN